MQKNFILIGLLLTTVLGQAQKDYYLSDSLKIIKLDEGVTVQATRVKEGTPATFNDLTKPMIQSKITNGGVTEILEGTPSLISTSDAGTGIGYSGFRIRGADGTRINVTINGIPLNDMESQSAWFVNLPDFASRVDNVQIQRGVGTSTNGAASFGGSLNFQTDGIQDKPFFEASESYGSFNTFRHYVKGGTGLIKNHFSAEAAFSMITSEGYIDRATAKMSSVYFTANYLMKKSILKFNLIHGNEKTYQAWDGVPSYILDTNRTYNGIGAYYDSDGNLKYYDNETDNYKQTHYQLFFSHHFNNHWSLNLAAHFTPGRGYYEQYRDDVDLKDYGLSPIYLNHDTIYQSDLIDRKYMDANFYGMTFSSTYDNLKNIDLTFGGAANMYQSRHYGTFVWLQYAGDTEKDAYWYYGTGAKFNFNFYTKLNWTIAQKTRLYFDVQYRYINYKIAGIDDNLLDITQQYQWHFFNPKVGVYQKIGDKNVLYFSFGMANREPTRSDLTDAPDMHKPVPETLYDFELGHVLKFQKYQLTTNLYAMYYQNQLVLTGEINNVGAAIMTNINRSYRLGIEIQSSYKPCKWFQWNINGTFSLNKIIGYTEYVDDWDSGIQRVNYLGNTDISFSPNVILNNHLIFHPLKHFDIALQTQFVSQQYIDNTSNQNRVLKPYCYTDFNISYTFITKVISEIKLFVTVKNLFNAKYETNAWIYRYYENDQELYIDGYFPQSGIHCMGGIAIKF